jgi:ATP-dependent DNA helicase RecG
MRRDDTPAHEALREAFVNALIHADYMAPGGVVVERYPDRFIFGNPGTLLVSLEQFRRGGVSECRNKSLQKMFLMIGGGEQAGSGVDKIRSGWRSRHWRAPLISTQPQPERVVLTLPMVSLIPEATLAHLRERFGSRMNALTPAEVQALATADIEGSVSNARLQELLTDHPVEITRMLSRLCEQGYLISDNRRRWTTYRIVLSVPPQDSSHLPGDSSHLPGDSSHLAKQLPLLPLKEEELRELAESVARRGKVPSDEMQKVIGLLCKGRFLTAEELATQLNRTASNLRNRYLTPMVAGGLLKLRYPESPNRPDQAYTATDTNP